MESALCIQIDYIRLVSWRSSISLLQINGHLGSLLGLFINSGVIAGQIPKARQEIKSWKPKNHFDDLLNSRMAKN